MSIPILAPVLVALATPIQLPHAPPVLVPLAGVIRTDLAGQSLSSAPGFTFVRSFIELQPMRISIDPVRYPQVQGANGNLFVVAHKSQLQWQADPTLVDVRGGAQAVAFPGVDLPGNALDVSAATLSGDAGDLFGVAYDLVVDFNLNSLLDAGDFVDGLDDVPGMWVVEAPNRPGHHNVTEVLYSGGSWLDQDLYFPSDIATMGQLPLVVVSHGNGHNYTWYDHIGQHLGSWGCIVMSHSNNTGPGPDSASLTTLSNTDYLLNNLGTIAGGQLQGHVDANRIVWIGHSRGGEGVARAYDRLYDGTAPLPVHFNKDDIKLISSIAPTDFLGAASAFPHEANYHLWVGGADSDVTGCADCDICQSFHLFGRARGTRHSISLHGVGHGAFHADPGNEWVTGPCQVHRADTHVIMKAELVPLVKWYTEGTPASTDFFWRQYETFQPPNMPASVCVVVDREYIQGPLSGKRVIDDYQTATGAAQSSSGGSVVFTIDNLNEGRLDDPNSGFTYAVGEQMNGMTHAGPSDNNPGTRGCSFGWNNVDKHYTLEVLPALGDVRDYRYLSFRACQLSRDVNTTVVLGDLSFVVALTDSTGHTAEIRISAYGGGIEEPYQRTGCGTGAGWANEYETIRIRLEDFRSVEHDLDLAHLRWIEFRVGPAHGDAVGRIGLDDVEFTQD